MLRGTVAHSKSPHASSGSKSGWMACGARPRELLALPQVQFRAKLAEIWPELGVFESRHRGSSSKPTPSNADYLDRQDADIVAFRQGDEKSLTLPSRSRLRPHDARAVGGGHPEADRDPSRHTRTCRAYRRGDAGGSHADAGPRAGSGAVRCYSVGARGARTKEASLRFAACNSKSARDENALNFPGRSVPQRPSGVYGECFT